MLGQSKTLLKLGRRLWLPNHYQFSSTYEITDIRNSHLVYVKDPKASLPYLSEVQTQQGLNGVVIKL